MSVAAIAAPVHARLPSAPPAFALGPLQLADGFVALVTAPGVPWLANAIALGPGPTVLWDPVVARIEPGPALAARGSAILRALGVARLAGVADALSAEPMRPPRAAVAALFAALGSGDVAARRRAALALLGRGPGLTPEGDDLLAGACITAAAVGDPLRLPPGVRTLTTPLSATLFELAAVGAGPQPVHALLELRSALAGALRRLEGLGASSGRAIALGVGGAAVALGRKGARAQRPAARCATLRVMSHPERRPGGGLSRRKREQRAYYLVLATGGLAVAAVVVLILAIVGIANFGLFILLAVLAAVAGFLLRRAVSP